MSVTTTDTVLAARLRLAISRLARRLRASDVGGLTPSQLSTLATVERFGPLRIGDLAAREAVSAPTMTRLLACVEEQGLVERRADPSDGRSSQVGLSAAGEAALGVIRRERTAYLAQRLDRLPAASRRTLAAALPILESLVDDEGGR